MHDRPSTLKLTFDHGEKVETTNDHPFYVEGKRFVPASQLEIGCSIVTLSDQSAKLVRKSTHSEKCRVYNLQVDSTHKDFVSSGFNALWVHNACAPEEFVSDILKRKRGSIRNAPLPSGTVTWDELTNLPFKYKDIEAGQRARLPGYDTIKKLLTDKRFDR